MKVLISGVSSGIGRATAELLLSQGHEVLGFSRRSERLRELSVKWGQLFHGEACDITETAELKKWVDRNHDRLKDLDALINNAGLALGMDSFSQQPLEEIHTVLQTNLTGLFALTRLILPFLISRKKGQVINLGSIAGKEAYSGGVLYCATKAAVHQFTEGLKRELTGTGVRVGFIAPGKVETEFSMVRFKGNGDQAKKAYQGYRPLQPQDIAETLLWMLQRPPHVEVTELVILSADQVNATELRVQAP